MTPIPEYLTWSMSSIGVLLQELMPILPLFVLGSIRITLTFAGMPAPFSGVAPMQLRSALSVIVALIVLIPQLPTLQPVPLTPIALGKAAIFEMFIGMVLGMTVRVTMAAAEIAGTIVGQTMGLGFAGTIDPTYGEQLVPSAFILEAIAGLVFFSLGCHHVLLKGIAASFQSAPIGAPLNAAWRGSALWIGADLIARGVQIAMPVLASLYIVQVWTAFVSRAAPRVHLFAFAFSISVGAGLLLLWASAPAVCMAVIRTVQHLPDTLSALGTR